MKLLALTIIAYALLGGACFWFGYEAALADAPPTVQAADTDEELRQEWRAPRAVESPLL